MLAIINGKVMTITNGTFEKGTVLVEKGKIIAVGDASLEIPDGAEVIDAAGKVVMPGLIDAHSHIGLFGEPRVPANMDGNEKTGPIQSMLRGIDSLNPNDSAFEPVLQAGVTTVYTGPGSSNIIGGTGLAIKTKGNTVYDMVIEGTEGMKMALGENPKRNYGERKVMPGTRMGNAATLRKALIKAQTYMQKIERAKADAKDGEAPKLPDRDLGLEMLAKVLRREMKARIHCHRADDIMTAIRLGEEFNLDFTLEHATEGYKVADIVAKKNIPCVIGPLQMGPTKHELWDVRMSTPGVMAKAGVKVAIQMDTSSDTKWLPLNAGLAVRFGMDEEEAFKAITINAAEIIGVDERLGSLEAGKEADIAIFNGHPLSNFTSCDMVIMGGEIAYKRNEACCK